MATIPHINIIGLSVPVYALHPQVIMALIPSLAPIASPHLSITAWSITNLHMVTTSILLFVMILTSGSDFGSLEGKDCQARIFPKT